MVDNPELESISFAVIVSFLFVTISLLASMGSAREPEIHPNSADPECPACFNSFQIQPIIICRHGECLQIEPVSETACDDRMPIAIGSGWAACSLGIEN